MNRLGIAVGGMVVMPTLLLVGSLVAWPGAMLSASALGWASWIGLLVSGVGLPLALWGVLIAVSESRKAASAAVAARNAIMRLRTYGDAANVAYANAQLEALHHAITAGELRTAQILFLTTKRALRLRAGALSPHLGEGVRRAISSVDTQLQRGVNGEVAYKRDSALKAVSGLIAYVTDWEVDIRSQSENRSVTDAFN